MTDQVQASGRSREGCLKGCLITSLVLVLLIGVLIVGGYFAGKSYLEARLPEWEAEYPVLGVIRNLISLDRHDPFKLLRDKERKRVEGEGDWDSLPLDLPVFSDALTQRASISKSSVTVYQEVLGGSSSIFRAALSRFSSSGWSCSNVGESGALCRKEERACSLKVTEPTPFILRGAQTAEVWVSCTSEEEAAVE